MVERPQPYILVPSGCSSMIVKSCSRLFVVRFAGIVSETLQIRTGTGMHSASSSHAFKSSRFIASASQAMRRVRAEVVIHLTRNREAKHGAQRNVLV